MVFASLLLAEYPRDMHCRIFSGSIPPPLSAFSNTRMLLLKYRAVDKSDGHINIKQGRDSIGICQIKCIPSISNIRFPAFLFSSMSTLTYVAPLATWNYWERNHYHKAEAKRASVGVLLWYNKLETTLTSSKALSKSSAKATQENILKKKD